MQVQSRQLAGAALGLLLLAPSARPTQEPGWDHPYETEATRAVSIETGGNCLIRGAIVHTAVARPFVGDVLVLNGDIARIGANLAAPRGVTVLDAEGLHLAPGVVDCHSHLAIDGGINEGTLSITAACDISDVIDAEDLGIWRALAGGVTTIHCLHGSANAIGGRSEVIKLKWGRRPYELRFEGAPQGIKFALGENPKQSNNSLRTDRFPSTRQGIEALYYRTFERAAEYAADWRAHEAARSRGEDPAPPRRDLRLEVLAGILEGSVITHPHSYRADEILMLIRVAEHFGFTVGTFQHVLEGYKVAHEMALHGAAGSTFADWWAYKVEAYDAVPQNAALMEEAGVVSSVNSDSGELIRHLNHEAAKSVRYAGLDPVRALALVTLGPAVQLGIADRVGSIEVGKDADLVLWTHDPLSTYARVEWTLVDGEVEFQRVDAFGLDAAPLPVRALEEVRLVPPGWAPGSGEWTAFVGGTLHPVTRPDIEGGTLLLRGERIVHVGAAVELPPGATVYDVSGLHLWPGMIALNTSIGLHEIGAVRATEDQSEIGGNQPDLRTSASINPDSAHIGVTRSNGITRVQTAPAGSGPIAGQSAVLRLEGMTWEELLVRDRDMLHIRYPRASNTSTDAAESDSVEVLRELLAEAREYDRLVRAAREGGAPLPAHDRRLAELAPYARGEGRVALHADNAQTILYALRFAREEELDAVLFGAREGWKVAEVIAQVGLPVVVGPVLAMPSSSYDPYDAAYANAAALHRAGVRVAIQARSADNTRNLPFHAGFAAAYGLPYAEALRAITYYPAQILGLERELGSLTPGKRADLVITDGDLLETPTHVLEVFIDGRRIDRSNRQSELYERYHQRLHDVRGE